MRSDVEALNAALEVMRDEVNQALLDLIQAELEHGAGEVAVEAGRVLNAGGKRLRPLLFLLAYRVAGGTNTDDVMPLALAFELIHTATLVHPMPPGALTDPDRRRSSLHRQTRAPQRPERHPHVMGVQPINHRNHPSMIRHVATTARIRP